MNGPGNNAWNNAISAYGNAAFVPLQLKEHQSNTLFPTSVPGSFQVTPSLLD